jgi:hypothetical protein
MNRRENNDVLGLEATWREVPKSSRHDNGEPSQEDYKMGNHVRKLSHFQQQLGVIASATMNSVIVFAFLTALPFIVAMPYFHAEDGQGKRSASFTTSKNNSILRT